MGYKGTGKGICNWCKEPITAENSTATVFKRRRGFCQSCTKAYDKKRYKIKAEDYKSCVKDWAANNPEKRKRICKTYRDSLTEEERKALNKQIAGLIRKAKLGITQEEYEAKIVAQKGLCAICEQEMIGGRHSQRKPCQDHNHTTGKLRDVLCSRCNLLIGSCSENIEILVSAVRYLQKHADSSTIQTVCVDDRILNSVVS